jgi:hypothetical protein
MVSLVLFSNFCWANALSTSRSCFKTSVADPDPHSFLDSWIRARIRIGNMDPDPDLGGPK